VSEERIVRSGYRHHRPRETWVDVFIQESLRDQMRTMSGRYSRLRAAVLDYLEAGGKENAGEYLTRLRREVGRQIERDSRTDIEREMDGLTFVGAHRRQR